MNIDSPVAQMHRQQLERDIAGLVARFYGRTGIEVAGMKVHHEVTQLERGAKQHAVSIELLYTETEVTP